MNEQEKAQHNMWLEQEVEKCYPEGYTMLTVSAGSPGTFANFVDTLPFLEMKGDSLLTSGWLSALLVRRADGARLLQMAADFRAPEICDIISKADRFGMDPIAHAVGSGTAQLEKARKSLGMNGLRIS